MICNHNSNVIYWKNIVRNSLGQEPVRNKSVLKIHINVYFVAYLWISHIHVYIYYILLYVLIDRYYWTKGNKRNSCIKNHFSRRLILICNQYKILSFFIKIFIVYLFFYSLLQYYLWWEIQWYLHVNLEISRCWCS